MSDTGAAPEHRPPDWSITMTALPELTPEQRQDALGRAAEARQARAELLASVRAGHTTPVEVLVSEDKAAQRMLVHRLIKAVPGYGDKTTNALMERLGIPRGRRVGGLGARQMERLTAELFG